MHAQRVDDEHMQPVVVRIDDPLHTPEHPFCYNGSCSCHENPLLIEEVARFVSEGLMSPDEATYFVAGTTI